MFHKMSAALVLSLGLSAAAHAAVVTAGDFRVPAPGFRVNFISIGAGIDSAAFDTLEEALQEAFVAGEITDYSYRGNGREGERTVCFVMGKQGAAWELVQKVQKAAAKPRLTSYTGTVDCRPE